MATKKTSITRESIISMYMNYRLEKNEKPKSVYQLTQLNNIDESVFYTFFGSLEGIEKEIYQLFLEKTITILHKDTSYEGYDMKNKLLSFYFTFFELLTANRSYVLMSLKEHQMPLKNLALLTELRKGFLKFITNITTIDPIVKNEKVEKFQSKAIEESAWIQFLLTLKFWMDDNSPSFEKTDIYIEKSVKLSFELMNTAPLESLIDFGKFLFQEAKN